VYDAVWGRLPDTAMANEATSDDFLDVAVEMGFLGPEDIQRSCEVLQHLGASGATKLLEQILIEQNMLSEEQVSLVWQEQDRRRSGARFVGPYQVIEKIGAGGFGAVYRARLPGSARDLAIKILPPSVAADGRYLECFIREAKLAATLDHDNIVRGLGPGQSGGLHYFAMEYVDGENVQQILDRRKRLGEREALDIVVPIARALQHANWHGLVHQDVKPENILIDRQGVPKLLDLGLARRANDLHASRMGTPLYISPETIKGDRPIDIRSDIYSLGATLYHMLTGRPPFTGGDDAETLKRHVMEELTWPQDIAPELSDGICQVLAKMLAKDPAHRYANPKELLFDLEVALVGGGGVLAVDPLSVVGALRPQRQPQAARRARAGRGSGQSRRTRSGREFRGQVRRKDSTATVMALVLAAAVLAGAVIVFLVSR